MASRRRQVTYSQHPNLAARSAHARGDRQFRQYDTSYIQPRRSKGPVIFGVVLAVVAVVVMALFFSSCTGGCSSSSAQLAEEGTQIQLTVPSGASTTDIADALVDAGLVASRADFTDAVKAQGAETSLKPGTYIVTAGTSASDIVKMLVAGPTAVTFTVPEGYTIDQVAAVVEDAYDGSITAADFKAACSDASAYVSSYSFLEGAYNNSLEGFLFPKTYNIEEGDTADTVVRRMLSQYAVEVASLDYSYAASQGLSEYDVLKLASIIERESDDSCRAEVASVFYNRLAIDMALQSDATVAYIVGDDPTPDDLQTDSPYNTYLYTGLPAGPICSPGLASLQAACSPASTDYYYFYFTSNDDGSMTYSFSETYDEHQDVIAADIAS